MRYMVFILAFFSVVGWGPFTYSSDSSLSAQTADWVSNEIRSIHAQAYNLDTTVLKRSLTAYLKARRQGFDRKELLTVVDYSKPSTERRLWVIDLKNTKVLFNTWVTHGKNSGELNATSFSNDVNSLKSSLGVFVTTSAYTGSLGYSLRVQGLEHGINDNALRRDVVFHGAWYASPNVVKQYGMLGRSFGCMAVDTHTVRPLIDTIKNNTVVVAYYPDRSWLRNSSYLNI
ncbi:MAG: murein L,D-transpeptidase catalytic domain family protein [Gammaproteobacteria bacterium]